MKIYEYKYRNSKLPDILKKINNNYDTISKANRTYNKFFYFDIVDFDNSLVYTLNNNQDAIVSHMHLFKVKPEYENMLDLPKNTYIIREVETLSEFRRKGYCKRLMNWINEKHSNNFLYLEVNGTNTAALKCYSFLKEYTNNKLQVYYDKFHLETLEWINSMSDFERISILKQVPFVMSKFILFSN